MKQLRISILAITIIALLCSLALAGKSAKDRGRESNQVLTVEQLAKSPKKFMGEDVTVKGVVAAVSTEKKLFTIVDAAKCGGCPSKKACGTTEFMVTFKGDLPEKKKVVKITGRLVEQKKGEYLLEAAKVN